jgi:anaerobic magnesium-protoporphyrin IX monomethyl ester cyclase
MNAQKTRERDNGIARNLGTRRITKLPMANFPSADEVTRKLQPPRPEGAVDVMLVNPPAPDGKIWIRSQHRVGRRSRENMIWPQVSLAQMAAILAPGYKVKVVDAIATRMTWPEFEAMLREKQPKYYLTQVTAPTLTNDMYGVFLAKSIGAATIAFGTHVTPLPRLTMEPYPALDYVLRGEPELTLRELLDFFEGVKPRPEIERLFRDTDAEWEWRSANGSARPDLGHIKGLVWRRGGEIVVNPDRPFIPNLDNMPLPLHHLLPLSSYRIPMIRGPYAFVVTSRGCPAGCTYCIKHVSYQYSVRLRSPRSIVDEIKILKRLGIHNIHMYADLFTVNRDQVMGMCDLLLRENVRIRWTCNSRVDYVDEEMLQMMERAGCWLISWGIESANEQLLKRARKGTNPKRVAQSLRWAKKAGIKNWGYFIIGLPGETEETIQQTIDFSKKLSLDLALFHIAAPHPGTPFFFDAMENGWFRPGIRWESVDMDKSTVLVYPDLRAEDLERHARRAFRAWAMRPGPILTYLRSINNLAVLKSAVEIGLEALGWARG